MSPLSENCSALARMPREKPLVPNHLGFATETWMAFPSMDFEMALEDWEKRKAHAIMHWMAWKWETLADWWVQTTEHEMVPWWVMPKACR